MHRCACLIIQNSKGEYLLQMRDDTPGIKFPLHWDSFGGGVEEGEEVLVAAARELQEELGVDVTSEDFELLWSSAIGDVEEYFLRFKRSLEWNEFTVHEGAGAGYFTVDELLKINLTPATREFFERVIF
jgi:8-oxo-dGTP pyrophosphatase MutT (NUDIX family)